MNMTPNPIMAGPQCGYSVQTRDRCHVSIHQGNVNQTVIAGAKAGVGAVGGGVMAAASAGDTGDIDEEGIRNPPKTEASHITYFIIRDD